MATFTKDNIKNLSRLCRIKMSEEEMETFNEHIGKIVRYVEQLSEVDLSDLTPRSHMEEQGLDLLREDEPRITLTREDFLKNTPKRVGGMVAVPIVIKS